MEGKLNADGDALGDVTSQFTYVFSRLDKTAQELASTFYEQGRGRVTAAAFLEYLEKVFGDPDLERNALDSLQTLRQRPGESFALFLPKFERLTAESGAGWSDMTKIKLLEITMDHGPGEQPRKRIFASLHQHRHAATANG